MSSPNSGQMYSALCPRCGAAIYGHVSGAVLVICPTCQWQGRVVFHYLPGSQGSGGYLANVPRMGGAKFPAMPTAVPPMSPAMSVTTPDLTDTTPPDPLAARREAMRQALYSLAADVNDFLRSLPTDWWDLPQWRRYNHLQEAHEQLFEALGGTRMGEYRPQRAQVRAALSETLMWALLLLDGAEQPPAKK